MEKTEQGIYLGGATKLWHLHFSFSLSMSLKCVVELNIPEILNSHATPLTLSQIASAIESHSIELDYLKRIMTFLSYEKIFTAHKSSDGEETLYELPQSSKWLLKNSKESLTPFLLMITHPFLQTPWHKLSQCVKEGGIPFKKAYDGHEMWDFLSQDPEFNAIFNGSMACLSKDLTEVIVSDYKDGFGSIKTLVDVGGGMGQFLSQIVKAYPHIKGINFDLPHVVATAPTYDGITNVGGNVFESVPSADAIFMKGVIHDWADEDSVKILKKCHEALTGKKEGKLVLVEIVLEQEGKGHFAELGLSLDLMMLANTTGGRERTEPELKKLLNQGGFPRYNIIKIPSVFSIIEAYPN